MKPASVPLAPGDPVRLRHGSFPAAHLRTGKVVRLGEKRPTCGACRPQVLVSRDGEAPGNARFWPLDAWEKLDG